MRTTQIGLVSNVDISQGTSQNGKPWKKTRFKFTVLEYTGKDRNPVKHSYWISTFNDFDVSEGYAEITLDIVNRKTGRKNDRGYDVYELALDVIAFSPIDLDAIENGKESGGKGFEEEDIPF